MPRTVLLVGNPNVGKSVIFGLLTGTYAVVSNYPGTTVEVSEGTARAADGPWRVIDAPGVNSLVPYGVDEQVTRDLLLAHPDAPVIQVVDVKNLARGLLVTSQLAELGRRVVLALNMADEAAALGIATDRAALAGRLGAPVVVTVAVERRGIARLLPALAGAAVPRLAVDYRPPFDAALAAVEALLPGVPGARLVAQMLLAGDPGLAPWLNRSVSKVNQDRLASLAREWNAGPPDRRYGFTRQRLAAVQPLVDAVQGAPRPPASTLLARLGDLCQHPAWGWPILILVLVLLYYVVGVFGAGTCVDFIQHRIFGETPAALRLRGFAAPPPGFPGLNWYAGRFLDGLDRPLLADLLTGPYGLVSVGLTYAFAIVLPIVGIFFAAFGLLEDSGYLPRLAILANRAFRTIGLNGKAVLPMVLGLGCDTMATLTTRILPTRRERLIATLLLALAVPCSAQLGVILGIAAETAAWMLPAFGLTVAAQFFIVGWLAARVLPGEPAEFIIEIPPLRRPRLVNVLVKTWFRIVWFLKEAVPLFLLGTLALFLADRTGLLERFIAAAAPAVRGLLGLPPECARIFAMGFLRRDYGAAGLFDLFHAGALSELNVLVALVTLTLFLPCVANFFIIIKEQGWRKALGIFGFVTAYAVLTGAAVNFAGRLLGLR